MKNYFRIIVNLLKPSSNKITAGEYFILGSDSLKNEDCNAAIVYFNKSIKLDNTIIESYRLRAFTYLKTKNFKKALKDYNKVISTSSKNKDDYLERGVTYLKLRKHNEAILDCDLAIKLDSEYGKAYMLRGVNKYFIKEYKNAIIDLEKAEEYDKEIGIIIKPYIDDCRRQINRSLKSEFKNFINNPILKEQSGIYEYQRKMIGKMKSTTEQDEIPWGTGEFGYVATNPIPTNTSFGSISYLSKLQTLSGEKVSYNRLGSTQVINIENPVDIYEISDSNGFICKLYISMYHRKTSEKIPRNFKRA